ncbi:TonB-dependent receptor [Sessilibacter corallicola]|uniref:TonB-dependent receptor n=1 Tax=Sessilibacter corallicola TaxID=2904075 RepID=A0ABQ0A6K3_9GAMM
MKTSLINGLAASALVLSAFSALADDELVIYVYKDGKAASDITVRLDGETDKQTLSGGSATFDLEAGGHSVQLIQNGTTIHSFRFDSAQGQLTDINVAIEEGTSPKVAVESFYKTETAAEKRSAPNGSIKGRVTSGGVPVANATITLTSDSAVSTTTDADGNYDVEVARGVYNLTISHPDMKLVELDDVRVISNVAKGLNFTMNGRSSTPSLNIATPQIEEVTVLAQYNPNAFEESERFSANVIDTLGIEQLARFGDSDIAGSVVRLPSVTVQDDSFVFIRGLGGRYVTTTLNGATLPSTNPNRRSVPLDLFPSNIVSQLDVKKTFLSSLPGESTGGNLEINTRNFPDEGAGKLSIKTGFVTDLTGETVASDPSDGDFDFFGFDDGTRDEPLAVEAIAIALDPGLALGLDDDGVLENIEQPFSDETEVRLRQAAGLLLVDNLDLEEETAIPNVSVSFNYGDLFYVGDNELGYFAALNYKTGYEQKRDGVSRTFSTAGNGQVEDDFTFDENTFNVNISGLLSFGLNVGNSTYEANTIISRVTANQVRVSEGEEGDSGEQSFQYTIDYEERQFLSQQFSGEHFLDEAGNFLTNWQVTASQTTRFAPDRREVQFNIEQDGEPFRLQLSETIRRYDELEDFNYDVSNNYEWLISSDGSLDQTLSFGWQYIYQERDSESATYGFNHGDTIPDLTLAPNLLVSDVINEDNITGDASTGLQFFDRTLPSDSYDSELTQYAGYISYDVLINSEFQFIIGGRFEDFDLTTDTFELAGAQAATSSNIDEGTFLPTLGFNWIYSDEQQIRFALTKTVSRPDFKEASNATFFDKEFNFRVRGNPNLEVAEVLNLDVRWEYYWSDTGNVSVAAFYKDFDDPIERVILIASGTAGNSRTFENSDSAELFGVEVDSRIDFPLNDGLTQSLFVATNASVIDAETTLVDGTTRDFQGAPEYTFNLIVGWDDLEGDQELTVLFNQNGETSKDSGRGAQGDVIQEPFASLNVNYKKTFANEITFSAKAKNLLDSEVEFTQDGGTFQSYKQGIEFEAGIDWSF